MDTKGKFIVFEGTDGSGKSTQMKMLFKYLAGRGVSCFCTREPTDSPFGALLRSCLTGRVEADEHTIAAMFAADRLDHINTGVNGIKKKLSEGETVLCDRYYYSSLAYNGGFVSLDWVAELNRPAMEALRPDLVIYIDLPPEDGMKRVARRGETDRYETIEKQKKIHDNYMEVFSRFGKGENVVTVKSENDKGFTQEHIRKAVDKLFGF